MSYSHATLIISRQNPRQIKKRYTKANSTKANETRINKEKTPTIYGRFILELLAGFELATC